jgi:hypothetical protein
MTKLLEEAFAEAARRSPEEQDLLASRLLAELSAEDAFDAAIASSAGKLAALSRAAIEEHRVGKTDELTADGP